MNRPPLALSYSTLKLLPCPLRFWDRYYNPDREDHSSVDAVMGTLGHAADAMYFDGWIAENNDVRIPKGWGWQAQNPDLHVHFTELVLKLEREGLNRLSPDNEDQVRKVGENYAEYLKVNQYSGYVTERRYWVDRNYQPVDIGNQQTKIDLLGGTPDRIEVKDMGRRAIITDIKRGRAGVEPAMTSRQLMIYAALHFWHNPECDEVTVQYEAPMFRNYPPPHVWQREPCLLQVMTIVDAAWLRVDDLWTAYQDSQWPAESSSACDSDAYCDVGCTHGVIERLYKESA